MKKKELIKNNNNLNHKGKVFTGNISVNSHGIGYLPNDDFKEDIEIQEAFMNTALPGDKVEVLLHTFKNTGRIQGEVVSILERSRYEFVGVIERKEKSCTLRPDDRRVYRDFNISNPTEKVIDGHKAMAKLTFWDNHKKNPEAEIVAIMGPAGEHEVEMNAIIREKGFDIKFPERVEREAKQLQENGIIIDPKNESRKEMRDRKTFTIDPESAKDFDDALSIKKLPNGDWEIGVHIADVSHYVVEGSELDKEARKRGTSVYLVDRTIPMLPEELSNDLCSLNVAEDKRAFSAVFIMDESGAVKDRWFGKTIISSNKRFSYESAQKSMDRGDGELSKELRTLNFISKKIREKRFKKGAIDFDTKEVGFELDKNGVPTRIFIKERMDTNKLIEEFMLLANREVAFFLYGKDKKGDSKKKPVIYRVHDRPDPEKMQNLLMLLKALGHNVSINPKDISSKDLNRILRVVTGKTEETLVKTASIRAMAKAIYSTENVGHFGLAFKHYAHFTSPIRRYPDLIIHRLLSKRIAGKTISPKDIKTLEVIAKDSTDAEIKATEAERESIKFKQVEFMKNHKGEVFDAVISGVTGWGLYVEEQKTLSSGMIHVSGLDSDYYEFNEKKFSLVGKRTGKKFTLGDKIKVELIEANVEERQLTFKIIQK